MEEILLSEPPRARNHPRDGGRSTAVPFDISDQLQAMIRSASAPLWKSFDGSPRQSAPSDPAAERTLGVGRRLLAAFRAWRRRDRSWDDLHRLSDHMLKDIGLPREHLRHRFIQANQHID
jgi:uncharacterized protein YjiS (DUF1127 family)